ncbi:syntaxin-61-like [Asparagus officinalis]|uniref:syntaxin-61-like n=1 Tax=Asparagus officinalis TaxID=4686 RepID=UPI00098E67E0|nr:syntaxin-61-like [Asparagus officinalis]
MSSAQDPFYIVKEEIQESIDNLQATFRRWEQTQSNTGEHVHLTKEIVASCESIEWQVDELSKTISVAAQDPAFYGLDELELEKRRRWSNTVHNQVNSVRKAVEAGRQNTSSVSSGVSGSRQEFMKLQNDYTSQTGISRHHVANDNDDFISSESDHQQLLIRQQDDELDELTASVQRIGGVGLTIHEELSGQDRILGDLSVEMETTSNRLDFIQKKVATVMKKASAKGQLMMILFLVVLFIILFVLVFLT